MAIVGSIAELQMVMMKQIRDAMEDNSEWLVEQTKDMVDKTVYKAYSPDVYHRTNYLKDSIEITNQQSSNRYYSMTVGHNLENRDWWSISDHSINYVPQIVHYGRVGSYIGYGENQFGETVYHNIQPKGRAYGRPRPYMDRTVKSLKSRNKYLKQIVATLGNGATIV